MLKSILASAIKTKVRNEQKRFGQGRAEELHSRILGGVDAEFMSLLSADITTIGHFFGQRLAELQERANTLRSCGDSQRGWLQLLDDVNVFREWVVLNYLAGE